MTDHGRPAPLLQRAHVHCPITALAVLGPSPDDDDGDSSSSKLCIVLSGEDTHLRIRDAATGRLRASVHVFAAQPIQGIGVLGADDHVLVWGGPWVAVVSRARIRRLLSLADRRQEGAAGEEEAEEKDGEGNEEDGSSSNGAGPAPAPPSLALSRGEVLRAPDWIYHASLSAASPASLAAVITAHNEVIPLHISTTPGRRRPEGGGGGGEGAGEGGGEGLSLRWGRVRAPPSSRPILYSAQVRWAGAEHVLVAAGTAFGEIVVWRCRVAEEDGEDGDGDEVEVLHVLLGHEGSIFGVDISPEVQLQEGASSSSPSERTRRRRTAARFLASCSDDRTIRVWDITDAASRDGSAAPAEGGVERRCRPEKGKEDDKKKKSFPEARETGFGENIPSGLEDLASHTSSSPLATAMGHVSRIWGVRFAPPRPGVPAGELALYSFGEDATAQRWRLGLDGLDVCDGASDERGGPVASLAHEAVVHRHSGKHIWSSAVAGLWSGAGRILVVTGGSDGKINVAEEAASPGEDVRAVRLDISTSDVVSSFPAPRPGPGIPEAGASVGEAAATGTKPARRKKACAVEERFLMYALLSDSAIIATTTAGRVFSGSLRGHDVSWSELRLSKPHQDDLRQYQIVRSVGASTALLGSASGNLYMCHGESVRHIYRAPPGKIADIFPLPLESLRGLDMQQSDCSSSTAPVIVSTMGSSQVRLLALDTSSEETIQREHVIELEKGFMVTAAGCCQGYLIFGSRTGALLIYKPTTSGGRGGYESIARIDRPSTKDAVSCIIPLPAKAGMPAPYFLTTSRDGRYRIYEITPGVTTDEIHTHMRHEALPPLGPVIESAFFSTPSSSSSSCSSSPSVSSPAALSSPELILAGFRGGSFVVWNETRQLELASVACGSGHRSFTHRADPRRPDHLAAVWTRAARTCVYAQRGLAQTPVKRGGHGREIKAVAAAGAGAGAGGLLATGAEDTTVRIWRYHRRDGGADDADEADDPLRCLAVVERHTTGIQCLGWAAGGRYLVSSGGNEELFVWRTTRLERSAYEGLAVVCEGVYPDKTRDGDLRIMGFDVEVLAQGRAGETRKEEEGEEVLYLSLALSNSTLKTYRYARTAGFTLLAEGRYTGACLTQIRQLRVTEGAAEVHILTASTDGRIALWKASSSSSSSSSAETAAGQQQQHVLVDATRLHQSSIKALDLCALPRHPAHRRSSLSPSPDSYVLLTGGDDDALGHARLAWSSDTPGGGGFRLAAPPTRLALARGAHAAAVTGLRVTSLEAMGDGGYRVMLCTASNDQRVRTWRVEVGAGGTVRRVALTGDRYSGVADCGDLERLVDGGVGRGSAGVVLVGVGMEVWEGV